MFLHKSGCPSQLQPSNTCQLDTPGNAACGTGELPCGTQLVSKIMLLNNRVPVLAKLASYSKDDNIFAFGIFCFCPTSNFPLWCQERFLSASTGRSHIRTAVLYLCLAYKMLTCQLSSYFYQRQCTPQQNIYQSFQWFLHLFCCAVTQHLPQRWSQSKKEHFCFLYIASVRYKKKKFTREMIWKQPTLLPWLKFLDVERLLQVRVIWKSPFAPRKCI